MRLASRAQTLHASVSLKGGERKREKDVVCGIGALQRRQESFLWSPSVHRGVKANLDSIRYQGNIALPLYVKHALTCI